MENRFNTICFFFEARSLSSGRALVAAAKPLDRHSPGGRREAAAPAPRLGALGAANRVVRVGEVVVCVGGGGGHQRRDHLRWGEVRSVREANFSTHTRWWGKGECSAALATPRLDDRSPTALEVQGPVRVWVSGVWEREEERRGEERRGEEKRGEEMGE